MGLLERLLGGANRVDQAMAQAGQTVHDAVFERPFVHSTRMQREGDTALGRIVGIERSSSGDSDRNEIAVVCQTDEGLQRFGMKVTSAKAKLFHYGQDVPLRLDGNKRAVIDVAAMTDPGARSEHLVWVEPIRRPPGDGIVDKAVDWGVQRRLKKGVPAGPATILEIVPRTVMGMTVENVDVRLQLSDGRRVVDENQAVPFYATWLMVPGEAVPVVLDADRPERATVDWVAAARAAAGRAG